MKNKPISLAYAMTWKCYCDCPMCHSGKKNNDEITNIGIWKKNVSRLLAYNGSVRLTLTGGDPMYFWDGNDELLEFIKYLHENKIHVCLNTTGINMTPEKLEILDKYLDAILLSVRGLTTADISKEFGITEEHARKLRDAQMMVLREIHKTNIRLEVSTVVTQENHPVIEDLGKKLRSINSNIIWRVEEYYRNGDKQRDQPDEKFDLNAAQYDEFMIKLYRKFALDFTNIRQSSKESRIDAPDPFMFPDGSLHTTSKHSYKPVDHIDNFDFSYIKTRRDWSSYMKTLRNWKWERDDYHNQFIEDLYTREIL